ncbi:unnamed protein product [Ectocarpus sp. CCAP 1310/34]|nr:unnamed protein product [Ectocarpus sp. CCAP 1310/34]
MTRYLPQGAGTHTKSAVGEAATAVTGGAGEKLSQPRPPRTPPARSFKHKRSPEMTNACRLGVKTPKTGEQDRPRTSQRHNDMGMECRRIVERVFV